MSATIDVPASVHEAETAWYDTARWPQWVDQLARVVEVQGDWPRVGSVVVWESGPAGRGRVRERVTEHDPLTGQVSEVEDDSIFGVQSVSFEPRAEGAELELALEYRLKRRSPFSLLVDLVFIRRLMGASLAKTLGNFRSALLASRPSPFK